MGDSDPPRRISVHQALGGGLVADVLLWKSWSGGALVLVSATTLWLLFEHAGYNLLSFVANVLLVLVAILFFWAKSAKLLNRPLPPLPDLEVSEEFVLKVAEPLREWINYGLSFLRDITIGRDVKLFLQVSVILWFISFIGSLFNFLTLVYVGVLLSLSVPWVYDKYQERIDEKLRVILTQYKKIDANILSRIPALPSKEKKTS